MPEMRKCKLGRMKKDRTGNYYRLTNLEQVLTIIRTQNLLRATITVIKLMITRGIQENTLIICRNVVSEYLSIN